MALSFFERKIEDAVGGMFDDRVVRFVRSISRMAAKQGGESAIENYQLLGKRALVVAGVVVVAVQVVGYVVARRSEEQRIERVVRRVLEEEQQSAKAEA